MWLVGMYGAVATTTVAGAVALRKGLTDRTGLVTELDEFNGINEYAPLDDIQFGGHEIRDLTSTLMEATLEHLKLNEHFPLKIFEAIKDDLKCYKAKKGTAINCGSGVAEFKNTETLESEGLTLRQITDRLMRDLEEFADDDTVVINVASTEPVVEFNEEYHSSIEGFERLLDEDRKDLVTASMLYAYAALKLGIPYGNFTPSVGSSLPALKELALKNGVPHAGNDGKTGETYMKTTIAPGFVYRNLKILGWMSYNILGDYDGMVLNHKDNRKSKIISKDSTLYKLLGYNPFTITEINFFPSLVDNKTAFNFIHFEGFLGKKMKLYFIWDGIDAILAAPLVIDIARTLLFAKKKGLSGVIKEMAFFFKNPMDTNEVNTHRQFETLVEWFRKNQ